MKRFGIFLIAALATIPGLAQNQIILPHIPTNPAFGAEILVENRLSVTKYFALDAYDASGIYLSTKELSASPQSMSRYQPKELFEEVPDFIFARGGLNLETRASFDSLNGLSLSISYRYGEEANLTVLEGIAAPSARWRVYPGDWEREFDGIALVSAATCASSELTALQYNDKGELVNRRVVGQFGPRTAKILLTLASTFEPVTGGFIEFQADIGLAVTGLRGSLDNSGKNYLFGNIAQPLATNVELLQKIEENRARWINNGISAYIYDAQLLCFCEEQLTRQVSLQVNENFIRGFNYTEDGAAVPESFYHYYFTVDELFDLLERAATENAYRIEVEFDEQFSYPTRIFIDWDACTADEETYIQAANLRPIRE